MAFEEEMSDWERDLRRLLAQEEQTPGGIPSSGQEGSPRYAPFATREEALQELDELQARRDALAVFPRVQQMDAATQAAGDLGLPLFFTYSIEKYYFVQSGEGFSMQGKEPERSVAALR